MTTLRSLARSVTSGHKLSTGLVRVVLGTLEAFATTTSIASTRSAFVPWVTSFGATLRLSNSGNFRIRLTRYTTVSFGSSGSCRRLCARSPYRGTQLRGRGGSPSQEEQGQLFSVWRCRALETKLHKPPPLSTGPRCRCAWIGQLEVDAQAADLRVAS